MGKKLYRLDIDEVLSNLSLFTDYDIGGEGHSIIVEEENLNNAIHEITLNFTSLIRDSFESEEEEKDEEEEDE